MGEAGRGQMMGGPHGPRELQPSTWSVALACVRLGSDLTTFVGFCFGRAGSWLLRAGSR